MGGRKLRADCAFLLSIWLSLRPHTPPLSIDINPSIGDVLTTYNHVEKWSKPEGTAFDFNWFLMKPTIYKEPKGTVLVICPFNYPFYLSIGPIVRTTPTSISSLLTVP